MPLMLILQDFGGGAAAAFPNPNIDG